MHVTTLLKDQQSPTGQDLTRQIPASHFYRCRSIELSDAYPVHTKQPCTACASSEIPSSPAMATRGKTLSICHSCLRNALRSRQVAFAPLSRSSRTLIRAASSTSTSQNPNKPIVLEQPDKFRPPSHPARLTSRRRAPAAYNQGTTAEEKESQKTRTYPHMFPQKGSFMHWFLTDRWIHIWITMVRTYSMQMIWGACCAADSLGVKGYGWRRLESTGRGGYGATRTEHLSHNDGRVVGPPAVFCLMYSD